MIGTRVEDLADGGKNESRLIGINYRNDIKLKLIADRVHTGLSATREMPDLKEYLDRVLIAYPTKTGGIVFIRDDTDGRISWIDWYSPGHCPRPKILKGMLLTAKALGAVWVATDIEDSTNLVFSIKLLRKMGFTQHTDYLYSIKV